MPLRHGDEICKFTTKEGRYWGIQEIRRINVTKESVIKFMGYSLLLLINNMRLRTELVNSTSTCIYHRFLVLRANWHYFWYCISLLYTIHWLWFRIPPEAWMSVCCKFCALSGRGICDELITRQEESYWLWCVVVCDLETAWMRRPWPTGGCRTKNKQIKNSFSRNRFCTTCISGHSVIYAYLRRIF